jgi:hypothetical protein
MTCHPHRGAGTALFVEPVAPQPAQELALTTSLDSIDMYFEQVDGLIDRLTIS